MFNLVSRFFSALFDVASLSIIRRGRIDAAYAEGYGKRDHDAAEDDGKAASTMPGAICSCSMTMDRISTISNVRIGLGNGFGIVISRCSLAAISTRAG